MIDHIDVSGLCKEDRRLIRDLVGHLLTKDANRRGRTQDGEDLHKLWWELVKKWRDEGVFSPPPEGNKRALGKYWDSYEEGG